MNVEGGVLSLESAKRNQLNVGEKRDNKALRLQSPMGCRRISAGAEQGSVSGILLLPYFNEFDFLPADPFSSLADIR